MFATLLTTVTLFAAAANAISLDTPPAASVVQCKDVKITFRGDPAKAPYTLAVVDPKSPCEEAFVEIEGVSGTEYTWKVTQPQNTEIQFVIEDKDGAESWSGPIIVKASEDTSCLAAEDQKPETPGGVEKAPDSGVKTLPNTATGANTGATPKSTSPSVAGPPPANAGGNPTDNQEEETAPNAASATRVSLGVAAVAALLALAQL